MPFRRANSIKWLLAVFAPAAFLSCALPGSCQFVERYNSYSFLKAKSVFHVVKSRTGFLWFCTDQGLIKYDGNASVYYTRENGLPDNSIFNAYEDKANRLWLFCRNGQYCFIKDGNVHNEENDRLLRTLPHSGRFLTCMAQGRDSSLYFGFTSRSILELNNKNTRWLTLHTEDENHGKVSLVCTGDTIYYMGEYGTSFYSRDKDLCIVSDAYGLNMYKNNSLTWKVADRSLTYQTVNDIFLSEKNELFICTKDGLRIYFFHSNTWLKLLDDISVSSCVSDIAGNFWVTTVNNGIYFIHKEIEGIHSLAAADGKDVNVLDNGKSIFNIPSGISEIFDSGNRLSIRYVIIKMPYSYVPKIVTNSCIISYDPVVGNSIFTLYHKALVTSSHVFFKPGGERVFTKSAYPLGDSAFITHDYTTIFRFRRVRNYLQGYYSHRYDTAISASCQDPLSGTVYLVSGGSIFKISASGAKEERICSSALISHVSALLLIKDQLLIANNEKYLLRLPLRDAHVSLKRINTPFQVRDITDLKNNQVIIESNGRFFYWEPDCRKTPEYIQYPFSSDRFEQIAIVGPDCLVRMADKWYYFDTSLINKQHSPNKVYIKKLSVNGKAMEVRPVIDIGKTGRAEIILSLGLLDFASSRRSIYYRLTGPDGGDWQNTDVGDITFVLQKAGTYRLEIKPQDTLETVGGLSINLTIRNPFYRTTYFFIFCFCIAVIIIAIIANAVLRRRKKHFRKELNYLRVEHRAINAVLNPHFIFNSINNIQGLIYKSRQRDAAGYLAVLSRLIRQNLENLEFDLIPLESECALINRYIKLQNLRFNESISITIIQPDVDLGIFIPPLLIHTFVENAIVHGFRKKEGPFHILVEMSMTDHYLRIRIADDGIGINEAERQASPHRKASMGISFNRKRLKRLSDFYRLHQSITINDLACSGRTGTEVVIIVYSQLKSLFEERHLPVY